MDNRKEDIARDLQLVVHKKQEARNRTFLFIGAHNQIPREHGKLVKVYKHKLMRNCFVLCYKNGVRLAKSYQKKKFLSIENRFLKHAFISCEYDPSINTEPFEFAGFNHRMMGCASQCNYSSHSIDLHGSEKNSQIYQSRYVDEYQGVQTREDLEIDTLGSICQMQKEKAMLLDEKEKLLQEIQYYQQLTFNCYID